MGSMSETLQGVSCIPWTTHMQYKDSDFPDGSAAAAGNFCRNPERDPKGPWCDTDANDSHQWGYCDISLCSGNMIRQHYSFCT